MLQFRQVLVVPVQTTQQDPDATNIIRMASRSTALVENNGHSQTANASVPHRVNTHVQNTRLLHPYATVTISMAP